jgi:hypothetical protein
VRAPWNKFRIEYFIGRSIEKERERQQRYGRERNKEIELDKRRDKLSKREREDKREI